MNDMNGQFNLPRSKNAKTDSVKLTREFKRALVIQKIIQFILIVFLLVVAAGSAYIAYVGPIKGPDGYIKVTRKPILIGDEVVATSNKDSAQGRFKEAFILEPSLIQGEVIAGPSGYIIGNKDVIITSINQKDEVQTNITLDEKNKDKTKLDSEYVIRCNIDYCGKGKDYIVHSKYIKGVVTDK